MKTNPFYLYLLERIDEVASFQDGMTKIERNTPKLVFAVLFSSINTIGVAVSREENSFSKEVVNACVSLTYSDVYTITELILNEPEIANYEK